jgi:nucleotide-binding universal stress UspA family protein
MDGGQLLSKAVGCEYPQSPPMGGEKHQEGVSEVVLWVILSKYKQRRGKMMEYPKYKTVLFCTDFSENADYAFEFAYGIAKRDEGLLYILHVIPENPHRTLVDASATREDLERIEKSIEEDLDNKFREHYTKKIKNGIRFETVTKFGRKDEEILKFAKEHKADLIVMGTHGRTGIGHVLFGRVAERVLRHSPFPVFIMPWTKKLEHPQGRSHTF